LLCATRLLRRLRRCVHRGQAQRVRVRIARRRRRHRRKGAPCSVLFSSGIDPRGLRWQYLRRSISNSRAASSRPSMTRAARQPSYGRRSAEWPTNLRGRCAEQPTKRSGGATYETVRGSNLRNGPGEQRPKRTGEQRTKRSAGATYKTVGRSNLQNGRWFSVPDGGVGPCGERLTAASDRVGVRW
jgi:hypothetical protein